MNVYRCAGGLAVDSEHGARHQNRNVEKAVRGQRPTRQINTGQTQLDPLVLHVNPRVLHDEQKSILNMIQILINAILSFSGGNDAMIDTDCSVFVSFTVRGGPRIIVPALCMSVCQLCVRICG